MAIIRARRYNPPFLVCIDREEGAAYNAEAHRAGLFRPTELKELRDAIEVTLKDYEDKGLTDDEVARLQAQAIDDEYARFDKERRSRTHGVGGA
jgi:hypothetical protein